MNLRKFTLIGSLLALLLTGAAARAPADFNLWWHTIAGGGGHAASTNYALDASIGQPAAGSLSGGNFRLSAGFWPAAGAQSPAPTVTGSPPPTSTMTPTRTPTGSPTATATGSPVPTPTVTPTGPPALVVNATDDTDDGACNAIHCSLREALMAAGSHAGPDAITFDIPTTDSGYNSATGVWTIQPAEGYNVPAGTTVDGTLATTSKPGIEIDGTTLASLGLTGLWLGDDVTLRGLVVNHFQYGIWVARADVTIEGCYVGTDPAGTSAKPNGIDGILLASGATGTVIQNNVLSGNNGSGIRMFGETTTGNTVRNNRIGTNAAGTAALANGGAGIQLHAGAHANTIEGNLVSGNVGIGVHLREAGTDDNIIRNNRIGTDAAGTGALPNGTFGVALFNGPQNNVVGPGNRVAHSGLDGVLVDGSDSFTSTVGNTITGNSIFDNGRRGIYNFRGGNGELTPPTITTVSATQVAGTACANCVVEIFSDASNEGATYEGTTTADAAGNWTFVKPSGLAGPNVTATATDGAGSTSEFSAPASVTTLSTYLPLILRND